MASQFKDAQPQESEWFRLPQTAKPSHYDVTIKSDLEFLRFSGLVTIDLDILKETDKLTFNAGSKMTLSKAIVTSSNLKTEDQSVIALEVDAKHERATATLAKKLPAGSQAKLTVGFAAEMDDSMMGYYRSTWEHEGKKGFFGLTQFEPTSARRAIPGWDEPELKATYTFRMIHRGDTVALANMPEVSSKAISSADIEKVLRSAELELDESKIKVEGKTEISKTENQGSTDEWKITDYEKLPKVSSYLVAWANGPFVSLESSYKSPLTGKTVPLKIYSTPEHIHQAQFALDVKVKVLPEYEKVFDIPYALPKLDTLVATDFDAGAMENWGLITGRTSVFLWDSERSGLQGQKRVASVQSHEVAHQWFGNIATMAWWDNLWLNEAFATLMGEVIILDKAFPEWESASEFLNSHLSRALELDGKRSSHPIEVPLTGENVDDAINQVFDAISYSKGASVLKMLSSLLGEDVFLKGVSIYLKNHLYANSVTKDLWNGISEASGMDVAKIMANWTLKQGFPVITVTESADSIKVKQNRFLSTGDVKPEEDETLWYVPLALKTVGSDGKSVVDMEAVLNEKREQEIPLKGVKDAIFKLNAGTIGVYRVSYSPERWAKLGAEAAKSDSAFGLTDRVGLVSDAFTLAKAGYGKTSGGLSLLKALRHDNSFLVNSAAAGHLASLSSVWYEQSDEVRNAIDAFRADFFGEKAKKLTFEFGKDDSPDVKQLRATAISSAAAASDEWTLSEIKRRFKKFMETGDDSLIAGDLLRPTMSQGVKHGGEKEYEFALSVYRKPKTDVHKIAAMLALCAPQDPALLERTVKFLFSNEVRNQDAMYFFAGMSANRSARRMMWGALKTNYGPLTKRFEGNFSLSRLIEYSFSELSGENDSADVNAFFADKDTSKFSMSLKQGLDSITASSSWLKRDGEDVKEWLKAEGYLK